ncbi:hypothetical protein ACFLTD_04430 [Elusimicrobiota bacterium]
MRVRLPLPAPQEIYYTGAQGKFKSYLNDNAGVAKGPEKGFFRIYAVMPASITGAGAFRRTRN